MADTFIDTLELFPRGLVYVGLGIIVLFLAKLIQDAITPYRIREQLNNKSNAALGLSITGYYLGVIIVILGVLYQPLAVVRDTQWKFTGDFGLDVLEVFLYAMAGIVVLNGVRLLVDRLVLYRFQTEKEIIEDQNAGTAAVEFGVYVAVALTIAASIASTGADGDLGAGVSVVESVLRSGVFFVLGMIVLVVYTFFYQLTTSYDIHAEIEQKNLAVGVALGANLIAIGLVTFKAVFGEFVGWGESLTAFLVFAVAGFVLLFVVRRLIDLVLFPTVKISNVLAVDRNLGVAFIVGIVVISSALILYFAI